MSCSDGKSLDSHRENKGDFQWEPKKNNFETFAAKTCYSKKFQKNIRNVEVPLHDRIVNVLKDTHPKGQFQLNHHIEAIWKGIQRSKTNWVRSLDCENTTPKKVVLIEYCDQPWDVYISYFFTNSL